MQEGMDSHKTNGVARHLLLGQVGEEIAPDFITFSFLSCAT